jgi:hypothetical protein
VERFPHHVHHELIPLSNKMHYGSPELNNLAIVQRVFVVVSLWNNCTIQMKLFSGSAVLFNKHLMNLYSRKSPQQRHDSCIAIDSFPLQAPTEQQHSHYTEGGCALAPAPIPN